GRGGQTVQQEMVFTPRAKRVIELAFEEARQLNHNYIGTEHLLLGLIREGEGVAARVLTNLGVDPAKVRVQTTSLLGAETQTQTAAKGKSKTPTLDAYGRDLTQLAREGKRDPVLGETPGSNGSSRFCRGEPRTIPRSSANRVSERPRSPKA